MTDVSGQFICCHFVLPLLRLNLIFKVKPLSSSALTRKLNQVNYLFPALKLEKKILLWVLWHKCLLQFLVLKIACLKEHLYYYSQFVMHEEHCR